MNGYLAGLFEGEGTVSSENPKRSPNARPRVALMMSMTDREPLDRFQAIAGVGTVYGPYRYKGWDEKGYKSVYRYQVVGAEKIRALYERMKPWLSPRRLSQLERVLGAYDQATAEGKGFWRPVRPIRIVRDGKKLVLCSRCHIPVEEMTDGCITCYNRHHHRLRRAERAAAN